MGILENVHGQGVETILDALNVGSVFSQDKSRMGRTNMSDLISRKVLFGEVRSSAADNPKGEWETDDVLDLITSAPAITPQQPQSVADALEEAAKIMRTTLTGRCWETDIQNAEHAIRALIKRNVEEGE